MVGEGRGEGEEERGGGGGGKERGGTDGWTEGGTQGLRGEFSFPLREERTQYYPGTFGWSILVPARAKHVAQERRWMGHHEAAAQTYQVGRDPEGSSWVS